MFWYMGYCIWQSPVNGRWYVQEGYACLYVASNKAQAKRWVTMQVLNEFRKAGVDV